MQTFTVAREGETPTSTWSQLLGPDGSELCKVLERGSANLVHPRIAAGTYGLIIRPIGESRFDSPLRDLLGKSYRGMIMLRDVPGRSYIEIHPANLIQQLEGCLAPGERVDHDSHGDFCIEGGTSKPAMKRIYPLIANAVDSEGAQLTIKDIGQ